MFLCFNKLDTLTELCKIKNCKDRIEARVDVYMRLLKIRLNTIDYCLFLINSSEKYKYCKKRIERK